MEQSTPDWLTVDFLNKCLQSKEEYSNCKVTTFTVEQAVPPGNNFGSNLVRIKVNYKKESDDEQKLPLIAKFPLVDGAIKDLYPLIYESEPIFYSKYLKIGYKLLNYNFAPDSFLSPIDTIIIMEDLKEQGYKMADKIKQLDFEHCRCYMISAAHFHAMSIAVHKQDPQLIYAMGREKLFSNDISKEQLKIARANVRYGVEMMLKQVSKASGTGNDEISKVLSAFSTTLWDYLVEMIKSSDKHKSLSQGDPWVTNMMFKYDEKGKVCDVKLLDFQCLRWGCPADDLVFFIWSSANSEVRNNRIDELYQIYLDTFNKCMDIMHLNDCLTMVNLKEMILRRSPLALWTVATCLPFTINTTENDIETIFKKFGEDYSPENNPFENIYNENYCKNVFPQLLQQLKKAGVFQYLRNKVENIK